MAESRGAGYRQNGEAMNEVHESLARHDEEHYPLDVNDPAVLACVWCQS